MGKLTDALSIDKEDTRSAKKWFEGAPKLFLQKSTVASRKQSGEPNATKRKKSCLRGATTSSAQRTVEKRPLTATVLNKMQKGMFLSMHEAPSRVVLKGAT